MFRLGTRAAASLCVGELASRTFIRGARTRAVPGKAKAIVAAATASNAPNVSEAQVPNANSHQFAKPIYVQIEHFVPPPEDAQLEPQVMELDPAVFGAPIRRDIMHLCVVQHLDNKRQGSASTKTRGEVRGSGRKIRPQKGTGKARLGDGQSPMLKGGGVAFGPKPRDFSTKLPRKVRAMGMRSALSSRMREQSMFIVHTLHWPTVTNGVFKTRLNRLSRCRKRPALVDAVKVQDLDIHTLLRWPKIVLDLEAAEWLEAKWHPSAWFKDPVTFPASPTTFKGWNIPPPSQPVETRSVVNV